MDPCPSGPESCAADLAAWDREHVWHAFTQMQEYEPLLIERGEGCTLIDSHGRRYLDGSASMWSGGLIATRISIGGRAVTIS